MDPRIKEYMELKSALGDDQSLEELKKRQREANALKEETSQYGGLMDVARGLSFNKDVENSDDFIKQQLELAGQPVKDVQDRQKAELTASEAVRKHILEGLQLGQKDTELGQQADRTKAELGLRQETNRIASGNAALDNAHKTETERLAQERLDLDRQLGEGKLAQDATAKKAKSQEAVTEVEQRKNTIGSNIDKAISMIEKAGTYEALGPHNSILNGIMNEVATDAAKLQDPQSVARPGEVESILKNLTQSGMFQRNDTAIKALRDFKQRVQDRASEAYRVRGLEAPMPSDTQLASQSNGASGMSPEQRRARIAELRALKGQ